MIKRLQDIAPRDRRRCKLKEIGDNSRSGLRSLLPDIGRGTHENIIEQEEASLLGFDDFTTLIVDRLHHVVWADQVAAAITQKLRDSGDKSEWYYASS